MALGTVVRDVYANGERRMMLSNLNSLLRQPNWNTAGLYCYWDPDDRKALYIGLARNLCTRFAQHNSLRGNKPASGNKGAQINDWFAHHDRLGFSLVIQDAIGDDTYGEFSSTAEGQLIEGFRVLHGQLPPWNKIGGSKAGATFAGTDTATWFDFMTGTVDSMVVARRTIRELDEDPTAEFNEAAVHMSRTAFNRYAENSKIDDRAILADLRDHLAETVRQHPSYADLYDFETLSEYLKQPAPHPEIQPPSTT